MTTTERDLRAHLNCPPWCREHEFGDDNRNGGGVTVEHRSDIFVWSSEEQHAAWIERLDGYAGPDLPADIWITGGGELIVTADEARRLAAVLVDLADQIGAG